MDLNLIVQKCGERVDNIEEKVKQAFDLGYHCVALNVIVSASELKEKNVKIQEPKNVSFQSTGNKNFKILSRLTAVIEDGIHAHHLMQCAATKKYDIIAVQPVGEKMLQYVCANLEVDIISLDMAEKLNFSLKRTYIGQAIEKGICFEILYSSCLRDQAARRLTISNSQILVEVAKGRNVVVSSGALKTMELRGVDDVANLCYLFGLKPNQAKNAVTKAGQLVLAHAATRKNTGCGYVSVQELFKVSKQDRWLVNACRVPKEVLPTMSENVESQGQEIGSSDENKKAKRAKMN